MKHEHFVAGTIVAIALLAIFAYFLSADSNVAVAGFLGPFPIGVGSSLIKLAVILIGIAVFAIIMVAILVPRLRRKHGLL